jgi:hypothetical protein
MGRATGSKSRDASAAIEAIFTIVRSTARPSCEQAPAAQSRATQYQTSYWLIVSEFPSSTLIESSTAIALGSSSPYRL